MDDQISRSVGDEVGSCSGEMQAVVSAAADEDAIVAQAGDLGEPCVGRWGRQCCFLFPAALFPVARRMSLVASDGRCVVPEVARGALH